MNGKWVIDPQDKDDIYLLQPHWLPIQKQGQNQKATYRC